MKKILLSLILCASFFTGLLAQQSATIGKKFHVAFSDNVGSGDRYLVLKIAVIKAPTEVEISFKDPITGLVSYHTTAPYTTSGNGYMLNGQGTYEFVLDNYIILPNIPQSLPLPWFFSEPKAVYVESKQEDIALYALNQVVGSAEATVVLPVETLDKEYLGLSHIGDKIIIVTTPVNDNTTITSPIISPPMPSPSTGATIINKYETAMSYLASDMTNVSIKADDDIAVFATVLQSNLGNSSLISSDNLFEQLWPTKTWGKKYVVPVTHKDELVRILPKNNSGATITITGGGTLNPTTTSYTIPAGAYYDVSITDVAYIDSNVPIAVNSFMMDSDPSQCWINPVEQMTTYTMVAPFISSVSTTLKEHRLIIVTRKEYKDETKINGQPNMQPLSSTDLGDYTVNVYNLTEDKPYSVENSYGFNAYVYGYGVDETYHFSAGSMAGDMSLYFSIDDIIDQVTSCESNIYPTTVPGNGIKISRHIESVDIPFDEVRWYINGTLVSGLTGETQLVQDWDWYIALNVPTDTIVYNLHTGNKNIIEMEVYNNNILVGSRIGEFCIVPPPEAHDDFGGGFGNGSDDGVSCIATGTADTIYIKIKDNDKNIKPRDSIRLKDPDISITTNNVDLKDTLNANATSNYKFITIGYKDIDNDGIIDTVMKYVPQNCFSGVDVVDYCITSAQFGERSCAKVKIVVVIPEAKSYEACPGAPVTIGVKAVPGMTFKWYSDKQLTTQIGTGNSIDITAPSSTTEYYAVPNTGNDIKIPVTVKINTTGCGSGTLCNGSLLYSETFESAPLQYLSDYAPDTNNPPDEGKYIITNTIPVHGGGSGNTMLVSGSTNAAANDTVLQIPVAGALCVGKYSFGAWIKNMNQTSENIVPVFRFMLIDTVNHVIVHSSNIKITSNNNWAQYGFEYDVPAGGLNGLKLVIVNTPDIPTGAAGGNRFAIDDVTFSLCLNTVITHIFVDPGETVCANKEVTFTGNIQNPNYKYYKWQFRANSSAPWTDLTPSGMLQPSIGIIEIPPYTFTTLANGASSGEYRFVAGISNVTDVNCVVYSSVKTLNVLDCFDLRNDSVAMLKNTTLSFDVLANDDYFCTPVPGNNFKIVTPANSGGYPKHAASYSIVSGKIQYQPANNYTGTDSVKYEVTCGGVTKTAWLSIFIVGQEKEYKTCDGVIETLSVNSIPGVTYIWYDEEGHDVTNAIGSSITTDNSSIKVNIPTFPTSGSVYYYVRLHYFGNGSDYLLSDYKIKIEVKQEDDCININGSGCADYTTLFKEDFGGNRTTDPDFASIMPQNSFGDFSIVPSTTMLNDGKCMITKRFDQPDSDDHTYDADKTRGYFMVAKTTSAASTFYRRDFTLDLCQPSDIVIGVWLRNMSVYLGSVGYPKVNIKLTEQKPGGAVLYEGSTGNISGNNIWQYKTFKIHTTGALHETVRLELTNDNIGTNAGLLLGLDDIEVQICTSAAIKAQIIGGGSVCEGLSKQFTASFKDELQSAYSTNNVEFVWQYSADGDINKTWNDVYSSFYDISTVNTVTYTINSVQPANTGYYRVVAKYPDSNYPNCSVRSDPVELVVLPLPVNSFELTPLTCSDVREIIKVNNETGSTIKWIYPATINGQTDNPLMYNLNQNKTIDTVVVEITGNGCVKYDTAKIVMPQPPKIDKTQDMNVCQNKSFTLTAKPQTPTTSLSLKIEWSENKDFTVLTGSHITSQVEQISETDPLTLATPGIHKYYIRISDNLCSAIDSITVTVLSLPQKPTITGPANGKICLGDTVQLTASLVTGLTYSWTPATGVVEPKVLDERTLTVSPTSDIQYTVTVITDDAYKCKSSETYSLKVDKEKPEVEIIDVQTCFGAANVYLPAKDNNSKTNSSNTYLWTYDNSNNSSLLVPTAVPGTYQYTVIVTGSNGCAAPPKTANVTVNALPVINNNEKLGNHEVCPGEQIVLTAQNGPYSYKWDNNETGQKITVSTSVPVTHTVTITELSTGCSVDDIASITVKPEPVITVTPEKDPICYGETVKLTASGEGVNPSTYTWDHGAAGWETYVSPLTTGVTTYKVTGTGTNGCSSSAIQQITVNPKPANPLVDGVKSVCEGKSTVLKVSNYISGNKYRWSHELGESQEPSAETTVTPPATTQYTVTVEDGNGCTASRTETVKVNTLPNIIAQKNDTTICEDAKINIWVAVDKNVSYKWSTGATSNNIPVTPSASEKYSVTVIDGNQCEAATEINVAVLGKPVLYIAGEKKICRGDQLDLSVSGASDYLWTGNGITNSTDNLIDFPVKETVYWVTGTDMAGCSATEKVPVEIKPDPAKPQIAGNKHICVGESLTLTASGSGTNSVYYWTHESSSQESTTVSPVSTTAYTVEVTGDNGCRITETVDVTVNSLPVITKFVGDTDVCFGKRVSLSVDASDVVSFTWNTGQTSKDINVAPDVSQYYSVEMRNSKNCVVRDSGYVAVIKPKVWIEGDTLACPRESITLTAAGANSYVWTTGDLTADITVSPVTKT
ncbi:MAG: hypothetical protein LBG92_00070, partial [Prevotellaceae bacterium]|nr:hypothetical protein [Prevotellaceae bacterium]